MSDVQLRYHFALRGSQYFITIYGRRERGFESRQPRSVMGSRFVREKLNVFNNFGCAL
jgi:hypothetical protein